MVRSQRSELCFPDDGKRIGAANVPSVATRVICDGNDRSASTWQASFFTSSSCSTTRTTFVLGVGSRCFPVTLGTKNYYMRVYCGDGDMPANGYLETLPPTRFPTAPPTKAPTDAPTSPPTFAVAPEVTFYTDEGCTARTETRQQFEGQCYNKPASTDTSLLPFSTNVYCDNGASSNSPWVLQVYSTTSCTSTFVTFLGDRAESCVRLIRNGVTRYVRVDCLPSQTLKATVVLKGINPSTFPFSADVFCRAMRNALDNDYTCIVTAFGPRNGPTRRRAIEFQVDYEVATGQDDTSRATTAVTDGSLLRELKTLDSTYSSVSDVSFRQTPFIPQSSSQGGGGSSSGGGGGVPIVIIAAAAGGAVLVGLIVFLVVRRRRMTAGSDLSKAYTASVAPAGRGSKGGPDEVLRVTSGKSISAQEFNNPIFDDMVPASSGKSFTPFFSSIAKTDGEVLTLKATHDDDAEA